MGRFLWKLLFNGIIVVPLLKWFFGATFWTSLMIALGLCIIAYFVGDQLILRYSNNLVATVADAVLTFAYLWMIAAMMHWRFNGGEMLTLVLLVGVVEWFYHRYLISNDPVKQP